MTSARRMLRSTAMITTGAAALAVLTAPATLTVLAPPAAAAPYWAVSVEPTTWAYTDSRQPQQSVVDPAVDVPVGAWRDDRHRKHLSKAYFTFDLSALRGARILGATAVASETAVADCSKPRATELWITDTATRPTWNDQPDELTKVPGPAAFGCPSSYVEWDAITAVERAMAGNASTVTLALLMPGRHQHDPLRGRRYANDLSLVVQYNFPPLTPTELTVNNRPCTAEAPYVNGATLRARLDDFNGVGGGLDLVNGRFAIWRADQPAERTEYTTGPNSSGSTASVSLSREELTDGVEYAWAVQAFDEDGGASGWSEPCRFVVDITRPDALPSVSSVTYPEDEYPGGGGPGVPGEFTFGANGVSDVVGYYYGEFQPGQYVAADVPGGTATITFTPDDSSPHTMAVVSVDRAGNRSDITYYRFWVRELRPYVDCEPSHADLGVPRQCTFTPNMDDVVSYTYSLGGEPTTVAAGPDGTATVSITPPSGRSTLTVVSTTAGGVDSPPGSHRFYLDTQPWIDCSGDVEQGEPLACTFSPLNMSDVAEYGYRLNDGPPATVPAGADGTAAVTVVIDQPGWNELVVEAVTSGGLRSDPSSYYAYLPEGP